MDVLFSPVALGGAAVSIIAGVGIMLRRISRDKVELAKDRAEEGIISHLTSQRDAAVAEKEKARQELSECSAELEKSETKVRELTAEISNLTVRVKILTALVDRLSKTLEESKRSIQAVADSVRGS